MRFASAARRVAGAADLVVASTLDILDRQDIPQRVPSGASRKSLAGSLGEVEARTGVPLCVLDRALLFDARGSIAYPRRVERSWPIDEVLRLLALRGDDQPPDFTTHPDDGLFLIRTRHYDTAAPETVAFLEHQLAAETFRGSLPDLAEQINASLFSAEEKLLSAGEIWHKDASVRLEIAEGASVLEVLLGFARKRGRGGNLTLRDLPLPGLARSNLGRRLSDAASGLGRREKGYFSLSSRTRMMYPMISRFGSWCLSSPGSMSLGSRSTKSSA